MAKPSASMAQSAWRRNSRACYRLHGTAGCIAASKILRQGPMSPKLRSTSLTEKKDVIRATDTEAIRLAKTLLRTARFGAIAVIEAESGSPLASRVGVARSEERRVGKEQ